MAEDFEAEDSDLAAGKRFKIKQFGRLISVSLVQSVHALLTVRFQMGKTRAGIMIGQRNGVLGSRATRLQAVR